MSNRFYLKVAFQTKIKKYVISSSEQINFQHIHSSLGIQQSSDSLFYYQLQDTLPQITNTPNTLLTEEQIISELTHMTINANSTIKLKIVEKKVMSEQQRRRKESQSSLQIPTNIEKKRSRSMEFSLDVFDQTCQTQCFDSTHFIVPHHEIPNQSTQLQSKNSQPHQDSLQKPSDQSANPKDTVFSKSTQILINPVSSLTFGQTNSDNKRMPSSTSCSTNMQKSCQKNMPMSFSTNISMSCSIEMSRISSLLKESMRVSEKQKNQLQRLKESIAKREQQTLRVKQLKQQEVNDVLELFGITSKNHL